MHITQDRCGGLTLHDADQTLYLQFDDSIESIRDALSDADRVDLDAGLSVRCPDSLVDDYSSLTGWA